MPPKTKSQIERDSEQLRKEFCALFQTAEKNIQHTMVEVLKAGFKHRGIDTNQPLTREKDIRQNLEAFMEVLIITSKRVGPFVRSHPKAGGVLGDVVEKIYVHETYTFRDWLAKRGKKVGKHTKGLFAPECLKINKKQKKGRTIHLRTDLTLGQVIHEGVHAFSTVGTKQPPFMVMFGPFLYEGVTQYFTDQVLNDHGLSKGRHSYSDELKCARKLVKDCGRAVVGKAYFGAGSLSLRRGIQQRFRIKTAEWPKLRNGVYRDHNTGSALCEKMGYL